MENNKIYYDESGWVFDRNLENLNENERSETRMIIVDEKMYNNTFTSPLHFAWKVESGHLISVRYQETPIEETIEYIRNERENEVFSIINRGIFWYETLTNIQKDELRQWYMKWLEAPTTLAIPEKPYWLK